MNTRIGTAAAVSKREQDYQWWVKWEVAQTRHWPWGWACSACGPLSPPAKVIYTAIWITKWQSNAVVKGVLDSGTNFVLLESDSFLVDRKILTAESAVGVIILNLFNRLSLFNTEKTNFWRSSNGIFKKIYSSLEVLSLLRPPAIAHSLSRAT